MIADSTHREIATLSDTHIAVYHRAGDRLPVIMLPGLFVDAGIFAPLCNDLPGHEILAVDLRGSGRSRQSSAADITFAEHLDDQCRVIEQFVSGRFHLVGLSLGGAISLALARHFGSRIASLTLLGTSADGELQQNIIPYRQLADAIADNGIVGPLLEIASTTLLGPEAQADRRNDGPHARLMAILRRQNKLGAAACLRGLLERPNLLGELSAISNETLAIIGADDVAIAPQRQMDTARQLPRCRVEILPGCGHLAPLEQPGRVAALLREHLDRTERATLAP